MLEQPMVAEPGTVWNYNGGGVGLLASILQKAAHQGLDGFAKRVLLQPLGIRDWKWTPLATGDPSASGGLLLRSRDLTKIGELVLERGRWRGRRIVSARWIADMTAPHLPGDQGFSFDGVYSYGYLWWLGRSRVAGRNIDWVAGLGWGGQRLYVVPSLDLVLVVTAGVYRRPPKQDLAGNAALEAVLRAAIRRRGSAERPPQ